MRLFAQINRDTLRVDAVCEYALPIDHPALGEDGHLIQVEVADDVKGGELYDAETGTFTPPAAPPKRLSKFEFMSLLTGAERLAVRTRASTDPVMADALAMLELVSHVECVPPHPMVTQMLGYVQQLGIMTADRKTAFEAAMSAAAY